MPTPSQIKSRFIMRCIAKGVIFGMSTKVMAAKFNRTPAWVLSIQKHKLFESVLQEVEDELYRTTDREISALRSKSFKVLSNLLKSKNEKILLEAFDRVQSLCDLKSGLGAGGPGAAVEEDEDEGDYLLSEGAINTAFRLLEDSSEGDDYIDVSVVKKKSSKSK